LSPELASVDPNFHPHPDRNRVYYAGSLKQALAGWETRRSTKGRPWRAV
jgi:hypothetical protein